MGQNSKVNVSLTGFALQGVLGIWPLTLRTETGLAEQQALRLVQPWTRFCKTMWFLLLLVLHFSTS